MATYRRRRAAGEFADGPVRGRVPRRGRLVTLRQDFEPLEQTITAIAARGLGYGVHAGHRPARWSEMSAGRSATWSAPGWSCASATRTSPRSTARRASERAEACPGRGITRESKLHFLTALPRIDSVEPRADEPGRRRAPSWRERWRRRWPGRPRRRCGCCPAPLPVTRAARIAETGSACPLGVEESGPVAGVPRLRGRTPT